jgi:hypothetical protein
MMMMMILYIYRRCLHPSGRDHRSVDTGKAKAWRDREQYDDVIRRNRDGARIAAILIGIKNIGTCFFKAIL